VLRWSQGARHTREIESAYLALRHTLPGGHVLRSGDRPGLEQETWALLTLYQLLRTAMTDAIETRSGADPDRASFTTALEAARDQLTAAAGVCPADDDDLAGVIGRTVLATLLPARRPRYSARTVKCSTSRYHEHDTSRPQSPATITAIDITMVIRAPTPGRPRRHHRRAPARIGPQPPTRRQRVTVLMATEPHRDWSGRELAERLQITPRNLHTQLGEWAKLGFITRTGFAIYALNTPPDPESSTAEPDP
jgi:hypothetical protein